MMSPLRHHNFYSTGDRQLLHAIAKQRSCSVVGFVPEARPAIDHLDS